MNERSLHSQGRNGSALWIREAWPPEMDRIRLNDGWMDRKIDRFMDRLVGSDGVVG